MRTVWSFARTDRRSENNSREILKYRIETDGKYWKKKYIYIYKDQKKNIQKNI